MNYRLLATVAIACFAFSFAACSGGEFDSGLPTDKEIQELSDEERDEFCTAVDETFEDRFDMDLWEETVCYATGVTLAEGADDPESECEEAVTRCRTAMAGSAWGGDCLDGYHQCATSVGAVEACFDARLDLSEDWMEDADDILSYSCEPDAIEAEAGPIAEIANPHESSPEACKTADRQCYDDGTAHSLTVEGSVEPHEEGGPLDLETNVGRGVLEDDGSFFFTFRNLDADPETDNFTRAANEFFIDSNCTAPDDYEPSVPEARVRQTDVIHIPSEETHDGLGSIRLEAEGEYEIRWIYVDQELSLIGECTRSVGEIPEENSQVDLELEAGWNEIVVTHLEDRERNYEVADRPEEVEWVLELP